MIRETTTNAEILATFPVIRQRRLHRVEDECLW